MSRIRFLTRYDTAYRIAEKTEEETKLLKIFASRSFAGLKEIIYRQ